LLSVKDLVVKFKVRGRILTAIRNISLDIYENESIAIVGESGSGKSVFTKTFAGMLDSNGFIDQGSIIYDDAELADTKVSLNAQARKAIASAEKQLNAASVLRPARRPGRRSGRWTRKRRHAPRSPLRNWRNWTTRSPSWCSSGRNCST